MTELGSDLLTVAEAAALLSVHPNTVRGWGERGKVPEIRVGPRRDRRYRREDICMLVESRPEDMRQSIAVLAESLARLARAVSIVGDAFHEIEWTLDEIQVDMRALKERLPGAS